MGFNEKRRYMGARLNGGSAFAYPGSEIYFENLTHDANTEYLAREGDSPRRPGHGGVEGVESMELSFSTEMYYLATDVGGTRAPHNDNVYDLCFSDATGTTTVSRKVGDYGFNEVDFQIMEEDTDGGGGVKYDYEKCRGSLKFVYPLNDRVMIEVNALAAGYADADHTDAVPALAYLDSAATPTYRLPVVNKNATLTMVTDEALPTSFTGNFFSGEVDLAMEPFAVEVSNDSNGVSEIDLNPQAHAKAKLVLEREALAVFNPKDHVNGDHFYFELEWQEPGGTDTVKHLFYGQITAVKNTYVNKRAAWDLSIDLLYPATASGTGTNDSGQVPDAVFEIQYN